MKKRVLLIFFLWNLKLIISLHALKLALNKSMRASGNEQGINKLRPNLVLINAEIELIKLSF